MKKYWKWNIKQGATLSGQLGEFFLAIFKIMTNVNSCKVQNYDTYEIVQSSKLCKVKNNEYIEKETLCKVQNHEP